MDFLNFWLIILIITYSVSNASSGYDCGHYGHWEQIKNSTIIFDIVQQWLTNWQSQCDKGVYMGLSLGQGIGSDIIGASNWFAFAIENNKIYKPSYHWLWSDFDVSNCSEPHSKGYHNHHHHHQNQNQNHHHHYYYHHYYYHHYHHQGTIDCYFEPLSPCFMDSAQLQLVSIPTKTNYLDDAYKLFNYLNASDACYLAYKARRSIQWIHGSFLHYITRPRLDLIPYYEQRRNLLFDSNKNEKIIGVHVRGGSPDNGRHPANISFYIEAIDLIANELGNVTKVFLCSDLPEKTLISAEYLSAEYPRKWKYILLPHLSLPTDKHSEAAFAVKDDNNHKYSRKQLVTEFMSDVDILSKTDAFIGTWSNMYTLVTALRIVRGNNKFIKHACFLNIGHIPPKFTCEGDEEAKMIWKLQTGGNGYSGKEDTGPANWEFNT